MVTAKEKTPLTPIVEKRILNNTATKIIPVHYVAVHGKPYKTQPQNSEMGKITNDFKRIGRAERLSIKTLFDICSNGQMIIPSNFEIESKSDTYLGSFRFVSSSLILLDVDDDEEITNPIDVLSKLSDKCAGLFYTFSHGIKGNRFRLIFQLDRPLTDEFLYKRVTEILANDLLKMGVPVDRQAKNPTSIVRTGIKGYIVNNYSVTLNVTEYTERVKQEQLRRAEQAKKAFDEEMKYKTTFSELKEMAEKIGYIASGTGQGEIWKSIVVGIKHHANTGAITQEEGWELFDIISGGEQPPKAWDNLRASGQSTIATLVYHAMERGYKRKRYRYALETKSKKYPSERHKVTGHIPVELAKELIERKERLLIDSPTGSGKSTSFINAMKLLVEEQKQEIKKMNDEVNAGKESKTQFESYNFYIFSAPTRALVQQLAKKHNVKPVMGDTEGIYKEVFAYQKDGNRVFIVTYDMCAKLIDILKSWYPNQASFCLVVDEIHKYVTDYSRSYRYEAINNLHHASMQVVSFIGLSGTTNDVLKSEFDKIIEIDNGRAASPCQEFAVYTYEKQKDAIPLLVKLIEAWTTKRKLLIYIQSKETISKLYDLLRKRGIITRTVSAAEKRNDTYKTLVEEETIPDNVQVLLATSVIADGINILNRKRDKTGKVLKHENGKEVIDQNWECIVVANHFSDMFNIATLKQCSNRLRDEYSRFSIFMQEPRNKEEELFNIDGAYDYIHSISQRFANALNTEFSNQELSLFRASIIEKDYGLYADNESIKVDTFFLRHEAGKAQEKYYGSRRIAFIRAVEKALHKKSIGTLNINEAVANKNLDLSLLESEISELEEKIELDYEARKNNLDKCFTIDVFRAFEEQNEKVLQEFKEQVLPEHYACIERIYKITDFRICKHIVKQVKRKADTYSFFNRIGKIVDTWVFRAQKRNTETKKILKDVYRTVSKSALSKEEIENKLPLIARKNGVQVKKVEKVLKQFFNKQFHERTADGTRYYSYVLINTNGTSAEFDLERIDLLGAIQSYSKTQNQFVQVVVDNTLEQIRDSVEVEVKLAERLL